MSASQQAKAKRRKMANGYAHMGNSLRRPTVSGHSQRSVKEAIAHAHQMAARQAKIKAGAKK